MSATRPTIADVIAAAGQPGHAHRKAVLGTAPAWLVTAAKARGLDVEGFQHTLDTSAVRHIIAKHGDQKTETPRGQIAITSADINRIGDIATSPDKIVFGISSKRGHPFIGYVKKADEFWFSFVQEMRTGRKELAAVTLYKHPATRDAGNIVANFRLDGRTDSGASLHIVDFPAIVTVTDPENMGQHPAGALSGRNEAALEPNSRNDGGDICP